MNERTDEVARARLETFVRFCIEEFNTEWRTWIYALRGCIGGGWPRVDDHKDFASGLARYYGRAAKRIEQAISELDAIIEMTVGYEEAKTHPESSVSRQVYDRVEELKIVREEFLKNEDGFARSASAFSTAGGRKLSAHMLAGAAANVFVEMGQPVTFGQDQFGEPTTSFCRVVRALFELNEIESHWRRSAEAAFKERTKDSTES